MISYNKIYEVTFSKKYFCLYLFLNKNLKFLESSKLRKTEMFQKRENCGNKRYRSSDDFNKFTIQLKVMFLLWHNIFFPIKTH